MNTTLIIFLVISVMIIFSAILALIFSRRRRSQRLNTHFGIEYDRTVETLRNEKKAQTHLDERQKHVEGLNIRPLSVDERERYQANWVAIQSKFNDAPGQAITDADRLIMEVMLLRGYPVSDFEQRAVDISANYPDLVSHYRAARVIAIRIA